ncbi:MAG TPA: penicillin-binding transpeptidase domain-containing protein [Terriglobales bacterium]|nr:penicillin-binding transpeptidase domain-containing protein [Terriglobales bacterium]
MKRRLLPIALFAVLVLVLVTSAFSASVSTKRYRKSSQRVTESKKAQSRISRLRHSRTVARTTTVRRSRRVASRRSRRHRYYERFTASSFTNDDIAAGDVTAGEDPVVRAAAIEALGNYYGTVVAIDPSNGRILAMVNQKLALSQGATPCSTIKLSVALAALSEGIVTKDTKVALGKRWSIDMTQALAHSNNAYFEALGRRLGFERVAHYAHEFGLGEMAGYDIPGEHLGTYPDEVLPEKQGGVGRMCSFGEGVSMTPLQLGAMVAAMANGGTLYYLQHPTTPQQIGDFQPKVKRYLNIAPLLPEVQPGMMGAVQYGTARSVRYNFSEEQILGKTGTCSKAGTRFGWFASYADTEFGKIVTVVFLEGGRPTFGPKAAEIAGKMYRGLYDHSYFAERPDAPIKSVSGTAVGAPQ